MPKTSKQQSTKKTKTDTKKTTKKGIQVKFADRKDQVLVTKGGLEKLKEEFHYLKTVKRKEVAGRLKQAIEYGDLSENSEYDEAKNEQAFIEGRILELEKQIRNVKIISEKRTKTIQIGTTLTVKNLTDNDDNETYTIVGSTEADPLNQKISNESPIGAAFLGKTKDDVVMVEVPAGMYEYKIINLK